MRKISASLFGAAFIVLGTSGAANAVSVTFQDFSDVSNLTFNGTAQQIVDENQPVLRLTQSPNQSASVFLNDPIIFEDETSFQTTFKFQIVDLQGDADEDGPGADGFAFVTQSQGTNALGYPGGGLGNAGIVPSLGVEFDTYKNFNLNENGNHIGLNINGSVDSVVLQPIPRRLNDREVRNAWVDYDGITNLLEVRLSETDVRPDEAVLSYNVDLALVLGASGSYVGFTAGTGTGSGDHNILSWSYESTARSTDQSGDGTANGVTDGDTDGATDGVTDGDTDGATDNATQVPEPTSVLGLLAVGAFGAGSLLKRWIPMRSQR